MHYFTFILILRLFADVIADSAIVWPKLLISNDGKDIRLAEPKAVNVSNVIYDSVNTTKDIRSWISYDLRTLYQYVDYGSPFDICVEERKIFFVLHDAGKKTAVTGHKLVSVDIDKPRKTPKVLLKYFFPDADGIAVDWITKKLYLFDADTHRIEVLDYALSVDSTKPIWTVLVHENLLVRSLVLDPLNGYMYWLNSNENEIVERAWMDGTNRRWLMNVDFGYAFSFCIDNQANRLYFSVHGGSIWSSTIDGDDRRLVLSSLSRPYAITVFENLLLWGDVSEKVPGVYYCDKRSCTEGERLIEKLKPYTLRIFESKQQATRSNPCGLRNGNCSDLCLLTPRIQLQRSCVCRVGRKLLSDGLTCNSGPEQLIISAQRTSIRLVSLDTSDYTDQRIPIEKIEHAVSVDYDPTDGYVYWLDTELEMIRRVKFDGSGEEDVIIGVNGQSEGLAVDWIAKNIYWTDAGNGRVEVARIGHWTARRIIVSCKRPRTVLVDPRRGHLYWTDLDDSSPSIEKSFTDGTSRTVLVRLSSGEWPNGLAVDPDGDWIYWIDAYGDILERANARDGSNRRRLAEFPQSHSWGLTILGDYVYWSDMQHWSIVRSSKTGNGSYAVLGEYFKGIMGIKGVSMTVEDSTNDCGSMNGGCSHLCFFRPTGTICACPLGWELASDERTCTVPQGFLVFTQKNKHDITIASLSRFPTNLDYVRLHNISGPFTLDYDYKRKYLYWTGSEGETTLISRACLNGSGVETVVEYGLSMGESLAIDWIAEQIYWSDAGYNHIEMARSDGRSRKVIVWKNIKPGALVVSPSTGYLYWVNWKETWPMIERSELDGTNRKTFLSNVGHVSSITLDHTRNRLYWSAVDTGTIHFVDVDGDRSRHELVSGYAMQPYGLSVLGDHLYWADWYERTIEFCEKTTGLNRTVLYTNQDSVKSLTAVHALKQQGWNGCSGEKKCEHLCFARASYVGETDCGCPTHYSRNNDGRTCSPPSTFILFMQGSIMRRSSEYIAEGPLATLPLKGLGHVVVLKYDPINRTIYWMERTNESVLVKRASENEKKPQILNLYPSIEIMDFAIDPMARLIFWIAGSASDGNRSPSIRVSKLIDGIWKYLGVVLSNVNVSPKWIAVDPLRGYLFLISTIAEKSAIIRCTYEGASCTTLAKEPEMFASLHVDLETGSLFWYNRNRRSVSTVKNDGNDYVDELATNVNEPYGLTTLKERLYYVDQRGRLYAIDKNSGKDKSESVRNQRLTGLKAILAVDEVMTKRLATSDVCSNAQCMHICSVQIDSESKAVAKCGCPVDKKLEKNYKGESDCIDSAQCAPYEWPCSDGSCISGELVCNGNTDCVDDGSDEMNCTCTRNEFHCDSGSVKCVDMQEFCNGVKNCDDGSDERHCSPTDADKMKNADLAKHRNDERKTVGLDPVLTIILYGIACLGFICVAYGVVRCGNWRCGKRKRRDVINATDGAALQLLVLTPSGAPSGQQHGATTTTVEYSATCRVIHHQQAPSSDAYSISPLPRPFGSDERPTVTGKSSSSDASSDATDQHRVPLNPPPSPATMVTVNACNYYGRRRRLRYDEREDACTMESYRPSNPPHSHRRHRRECYDQAMCSPPPPYSACVEDESRFADSSPNDRDINTRFQEGRSRHRRKRRRSSGNRRRRNNDGSIPPPCSPRSSHGHYDGPPPTPNDSSSCVSSIDDAFRNQR